MHRFYFFMSMWQLSAEFKLIQYLQRQQQKDEMKGGNFIISDDRVLSHPNRININSLSWTLITYYIQNG